MFYIEKLEWCGYLIVEMFENIIFTRFDRIHEVTDRQTDRWTDGHRTTA